MRRLLVVLSVILALGVLAPLGAIAPHAAAAQDAPLDRTDARIALPFGPDGLQPDLTETATVAGVCGFSSLMSTGRPDAWECLGDDNQVYDPCFENPYAPADAPGVLACFVSPFAGDVVLLALDEPLTREKEQGSGDAVPPWDIPWALELANGDRCTVLADIDLVLAGEPVHYACADGGMILGEVDRTFPVWTVHYLAAGASLTTLTTVSAALV